MSLIPEVKCRRCGERFSSLRSRCPNCGTRRVAQSSRTPSATPGTVSGTASYERAGTNTRWQMIFGLILVVAVILAVIVMVSTSLNGTDVSVKPNKPASAVEPTLAPGAPVVEPVPTPTPTPPPTVEVIQIRYGDDEKDDITMPPGQILTFNAYVSPLTITDKVKWSIDDPDEEYFVITVDPDDGNKITIECLKYRETPFKLSAELFGKKVECIIRTSRA